LDTMCDGRRTIDIMMILFIPHDGGTTGAPMVLLHLLKWLRSNKKLEMWLLVKTNGPLVESLRSVVRLNTCVCVEIG